VPREVVAFERKAHALGRPQQLAVGERRLEEKGGDRKPAGEGEPLDEAGGGRGDRGGQADGGRHRHQPERELDHGLADGGMPDPPVGKPADPDDRVHRRRRLSDQPIEQRRSGQRQQPIGDEDRASVTAADHAPISDPSNPTAT
jgi:hypothetical protein